MEAPAPRPRSARWQIVDGEPGEPTRDLSSIPGARKAGRSASRADNRPCPSACSPARCCCPRCTHRCRGARWGRWLRLNGMARPWPRFHSFRLGFPSDPGQGRSGPRGPTREKLEQVPDDENGAALSTRVRRQLAWDRAAPRQGLDLTGSGPLTNGAASTRGEPAPHGAISRTSAQPIWASLQPAGKEPSARA
jgi:hypothetical protein